MTTANEIVLTDRQQFTLSLIGEGLSTKEIAARLGVKERTAKAHVDLLRVKFGVKHKRNLVPIALERSKP